MSMDVSTGKVSPGDPFRVPPAATWNNMVDAGRAHADSKLDKGSPSATRVRSTDLLKLKNSSGAERAKGEILKISGKVLEAITDEHIWLDGVHPTEGCRFGILKEPVLDDGIATAQVSGVCLAMVNITDDTHTFANASVFYTLQSGTSGPIEILYAPEGTGELECVVRFSGSGSTSDGCDCDCDCGGCVASTVSGCADCANGAATKFMVDFGDWLIGDGFGGSQELEYDTGCTWRGPEFEYFYVPPTTTTTSTTTAGPPTPTAVYQWVLVPDGNATTLTFTLISGTDDLGIAGLQYRPKDLLWNCRCPSELGLYNGEDYSESVKAGLSCTVCVEPQPGLCGCCLSFSIAFTDPGCSDLNFSGVVPVATEGGTGLDGIPGNTCAWNVEHSYGSSFWAIHYVKSTRQMSLTFWGLVNPSNDPHYILTLDSTETPCSGTHTLVFNSADYGTLSCGGENWPATIDITPASCETSTTGSSTTESSTTAAPTTTTETSSTTAACSGDCQYNGSGTGAGSPTGFYWGSTGSTCTEACGACNTNVEDLAALIGRWPVDAADTATLPCV